ncbi:hypothetical protein RHSIM_Rhsim07G0237800 [Rhododendron simsii]|uniref:RING-type domain-containing protein n=1 Tax=Rhododendron simsii TaxID=118357 RepID=A0A834GMP5_RHOSS|nr:hypothetical protein RHSIM_Rhsim07G0237800 [Rhododendron simsii]
MYIVGFVILHSVVSYLLLELMTTHMYPGEEDDSSLPLSVEELPVISFPNGQLAKSSSTCAICLEHFRREERCRVFPACKHMFHAQCIDLWLAKRLTCPVCRAPCTIEVKPNTSSGTADRNHMSSYHVFRSASVLSQYFWC